jgi:hypothetical protein
MVSGNGKSPDAYENRGENRCRSGSTKTSSRKPSVRCRHKFHLNRHGRIWVALAGEQQPGSAVDVVAAAARPAGGSARPVLGEPPAPIPHSLFHLFYRVEIRHRQLLQS